MPSSISQGRTARYRLHRFDRACLKHRIEHRFTKPNHPWTNGQVERMNRTLKKPPYADITTPQTSSSKNTSLPSWMPTTSPSVSSPSTALHLTKPSPRLGSPNQVASYETQPSSIRD